MMDGNFKAQHAINNRTVNDVRLTDGRGYFPASAPYKELYKKFGITAEAVAEAAMQKLK